MPKPINEQILKLGFMQVNNNLKQQKFNQYKFDGKVIFEEEAFFDNENKNQKNTNKNNKKGLNKTTN